MLETARACPKLQRLVHFSTCYVSGDRVGVVAEDELDAGQSFRNAYEETKYQAEKLVQKAKGQLPITIIRPSSARARPSRKTSTGTSMWTTCTSTAAGR